MFHTLLGSQTNDRLPVLDPRLGLRTQQGSVLPSGDWLVCSPICDGRCRTNQVDHGTEFLLHRRSRSQNSRLVLVGFNENRQFRNIPIYEMCRILAKDRQFVYARSKDICHRGARVDKCRCQLPRQDTLHTRKFYVSGFCQISDVIDHCVP